MPYKAFMNWVFNWLDNIYTFHGLTDEWDGAYALANLLRHTWQTNWAVEISVVMDQNDPDHAFSAGYCAYASTFGDSSEGRSPIVVMTYNNDNWGPDWMNYVVAHEVSHVFGTSDEYYRPSSPSPSCQDAASCGHQNAFLRYVPAENGNCEACNPNSVACYMRANPGNYMCSYTPAELGWRDLYHPGGACDPIDENTSAYMWIQPVAAGDLVHIVNLSGQLQNIISVTDDMLCGSSHSAIFWDGSRFDDGGFAPIYQIYAVAKNWSDLGTFYLGYAGGGTTTISNHAFHLDPISYLNGSVTLYVRHSVYDSLGNLLSRPRFDVMTDADATIRTSLVGYPDGIYTSQVYGWRSDDRLTNVSTVTFINYICMDIDNNGSGPDIADLNYLVSYMFKSGPEPLHMAAADVNGIEGGPDMSDLVYLVNYMFKGGPPGVCRHSLEDYVVPELPGNGAKEPVVGANRRR